MRAVLLRISAIANHLSSPNDAHCLVHLLSQSFVFQPIRPHKCARYFEVADNVILECEIIKGHPSAVMAS